MSKDLRMDLGMQRHKNEHMCRNAAHQQFTDIYGKGGMSRSERAEAARRKHADIYIRIRMCFCCTDVNKCIVQESAGRYTQTDANRQECTRRQIFFGDISRDSHTGGGHPIHRALRSYVLEGTGSEGPQQATGEKRR